MFLDNLFHRTKNLTQRSCNIQVNLPKISKYGNKISRIEGLQIPKSMLKYMKAENDFSKTQKIYRLVLQTNSDMQLM